MPAASFGPLGATAHRRFAEWTEARVWAKLHSAAFRRGMRSLLGRLAPAASLAGLARLAGDIA
ncbi:hypothetical protein GCM10009730_44760 [Streptomyces albidochromogenes]